MDRHPGPWAPPKPSALSAATGSRAIPGSPERFSHTCAPAQGGLGVLSVGWGGLLDTRLILSPHTALCPREPRAPYPTTALVHAHKADSKPKCPTHQGGCLVTASPRLARGGGPQGMPTPLGQGLDTSLLGAPCEPPAGHPCAPSGVCPPSASGPYHGGRPLVGKARLQANTSLQAHRGPECGRCLGLPG